MLHPPHHTPFRLPGRIGLLSAFVLISFHFTSAQQITQWKGADTNWWNGANWDKGVPSATLSARISIPVDTATVPASSADTAKTLDLEIPQGGFLTFTPGGLLIICGNQMKIQPHGTLRLGTGRIVSLGNIRFFNEGMFLAQEGTLEFNGVSWESKAGSQFDPGSSTVIFNGTNQQLIIDDSATFSFHDVEFRSTSVSISGALVINGDCTVAEGSSVYIEAGGSLTINGTFTGNPSSISGEGNVSLPVQLSSFTATPNRLNAELQWRTETELENYGFEIERREMGQILADTHRFESENEIDRTNSSPFTVHHSPWITIGFVQGSGTSSSPREYTFTDKPGQPGRYAYRLKQIDFDGSFTYYGAAEIEVGSANKELVLGPNYPNPFNPSTSIEFTVPNDGNAVLAVFNLIGQRVATLFDGPAEAGRIHRVTFSDPLLPTGLYFYKLEFGNKTLIQRMMLLK